MLVQSTLWHILHLSFALLPGVFSPTIRPLNNVWNTKNFPYVFCFVLQVFTGHIVLYRHTFPMAYCLLPNKERHTFNRVFMLLKYAAVVLGLSLDPLVIVSDFKLAMVQASTMSVQNANHRGCYYHLTGIAYSWQCITCICSINFGMG